jgi:hypothetical protein
MATYILMGLRYEKALIDQVFQEITTMEESTTYRAIIARGERKGEAKGIRDTLLILGGEKFGAPDTETLAALESIKSVDRLHHLSRRLLHVASWQDLLSTP